MRVVAGLDALAAKYVADMVGFDIIVSDVPYLGLVIADKDNKPIGALLITNYRGVAGCEISGGADSPSCARKGVIKYIFNYVFNTLGCARCTCTVAKRKGTGRTRRFLEGLGFVLEGCLRRGYDGKHDALIYGLLAENCRFLGGGMNVSVNTQSADPA